MKVKQISIFLENRIGRLAEVTALLGKNNINIRALAIADTADFGILRLIVNDPDKAHRILIDNGFTVSETEVVAIEIDDKPGALANVLQVFRDNLINVEYLYAFVGLSNKKAIIIFRLEDIDAAIKILKNTHVKLLEAEEVYNL